MFLLNIPQTDPAMIYICYIKNLAQTLMVLIVMSFIFGYEPALFETQNDYVPLSDYKSILVADLEKFVQQIDTLQRVAIDFKANKTSVVDLRKCLSKTRLAYKRIAFMMDYFYPEHIKAYINGAPLKHMDPNPIDELYNDNSYYSVTPHAYAHALPLDYRDKSHFRGKMHVVNPVGLQVLDELVFSENPSAETETILKLVIKLKQDVFAIANAFKNRKYLKDFEIVEASRLELIRIFTFGVTGYDTPGSLNGIQESAEALNALSTVSQLWLSQSKNVSYQKTITKQFKDASNFLIANPNFETFDRLEFLTNHINPLYKSLLEAQKELGITSSSERYQTTASWNANSDNLFAEDFLNPYYYSLLKKDEDNENLRAFGRTLFYDKNLSKSKSISCASCHNPSLAFTDGLPKSKGNTKGSYVLRNAPTLINVVFSDRYFYDLRAYDLEEQAEHVVADHLEFNTNYDAIIQSIKKDSGYTNAYEKAYNKPLNVINRSDMASALSSYVLSLRSFNSTFDLYVRGKTTKLSKNVKRGFNLFTGKANCATCHFSPTFSGLVPPLFQENETEVLGVLESPDILRVDKDQGRIENGISLDEFDIYTNSFKTVTVRNVALTAPYFHNGSYNTLKQVLDFYNDGGGAGKGLSYEVPNQTLPPDALNLSKKDINDLIAFMESLSDNPFTSETP